MTAIENFLDILREKTKTDKVAVMSAVVESVEGSTCTVKLTESDLSISEVLLTAQQENTAGFVVVPAKGSAVLVAPVGEDINHLYLAQTTEIESVKISIQKGNLTLDSEGFLRFQRDGESLLGLISELIMEIKKIVDVQGTTPDLPALTKLENKFETLLKK